MTTTQTLPFTFNTALLTQYQQSTQIHDLPDVEMADISVSSTLAEPQQAHTASTDELTMNFAIYDTHLAHTPAKSVRWLWEKRLPLSGLTLLDGDHGCGKSMLALQIAASISSGSPMPDGSPTIQGGVVIITPHTDANTTQLQS